MVRKVVSKDELLQKLNDELSRIPEFYECHYEDVEKLTEPDDAGCNWGHPLLVCKGTHPNMLKPEGFRIAKDLQKDYNLS